MKPRSAIQKGKELEFYVAEEISKIDPSATRQIGSGNGKRKGDIANTLGWCIECKNTRRFDWKSAAEQVKREALGYAKEAIIWHPPNKPLDHSVAIINLSDFLELLASHKNQETREEILDRYQVKNHLEKAAFHLKQIIKDM